MKTELFEIQNYNQYQRYHQYSLNRPNEGNSLNVKHCMLFLGHLINLFPNLTHSPSWIQLDRSQRMLRVDVGNSFESLFILRSK